MLNTFILCHILTFHGQMQNDNHNEFVSPEICSVSALVCRKWPVVKGAGKL